MTLNRKSIDKLMKLRNEEGLSIAELCRRTRLSTNTVLKYIHNPHYDANDDPMPVSDNPMSVSDVDADNVMNTQKHETEESEPVMASALKRKLESLGIMDRSDIRNNLKSLYVLLNKTERYMLKVYCNKCVSHSTQMLKESREELIEVGKTELNRLYDLVENGEIGEAEYEAVSEDILLTIEAELDL